MPDILECSCSYGPPARARQDWPANVERTVTLEVADLGTAAAHIRNGLGIGFLSWTILGEIDDRGLATVRVADSDLTWRLYVATSETRPLSSAAGALLSLIEEAAARNRRVPRSL